MTIDRAKAIAVFVPAKVNLFLHVTDRRADGYHRLDSLVAFADIGDHLTVRPADRLSLEIGGPQAGDLAGLGPDNLVLRAARLLADRFGIAAGAAIDLEKNLPVAAGLGGGSSDAAAALRALARLWRVPIDERELAGLGLALGADVPACLCGRPAWVGGIGDEIEPAPVLPQAGILLANPRRPLPTAAVFAARRGGFGEPGRFSPMPPDAAGLARALSHCSNDLTKAAIGLVPEIALVLATLEILPGALIARMSGSGATCFALFADLAAAAHAHAILAAAHPAWWTAAGALVAGSGKSQISSGLSGPG